jgi:hypothetical protein
MSLRILAFDQVRFVIGAHEDRPGRAGRNVDPRQPFAHGTCQRGRALSETEVGLAPYCAAAVQNRTMTRAGRPLSERNNRSMDRTEMVENVASIAAGIGAAIAYSVLYVAMNLPVAETLQRIVS